MHALGSSIVIKQLCTIPIRRIVASADVFVLKIPLRGGRNSMHNDIIVSAYGGAGV